MQLKSSLSSLSPAEYFALLGAASISVGFGLIFLPLLFIVGGAFILAASVLALRIEDEPKDEVTL